MNLNEFSFDLAALQGAYARGVTMRQIISEAMRRCDDLTHRAFIYRLSMTEIEPYLVRLEAIDPASLPLYGVPFAIKDNIDLAGVPTTAGCPEFAYTPTEHAFVVEQLIAAGAVPIGKTNLDQFATGLNGTRSPYGACRNAFNPDYISGGSSSGSSVAVAKGWVSFSLGTDTAGSGRVPASFNNLIGLKPTCGLLSSTGVVPACRSLDTVSIFALTAGDAQAVFNVAASFDVADPFSRVAEPFGVDFSAGPFRFGVPLTGQLEFFGDADAADLFSQAVARLKTLGGTPVAIDFAPFLEVARLLYEGPWVAERYVAIRDFIDAQPQAVMEPVRSIISGGRDKSAPEAFAAAYRLKSLKRNCDAVWKHIDCLLIPTAGTIYRVTDMQADPIRLNSNLGYYTNFVNLLDYSAVALPAGLIDRGAATALPWGVTLVAPAHRDVPLLRLADRAHRALGGKIGATATALSGTPVGIGSPQGPLTSGTVQVAVCGAHLSGLPLNHQLTDRGARLVVETHSASVYRLFVLPGGPPQRPGMVRVAEGGAAIALEVWELPVANFGSFVAGIPAPLAIGKVQLADGTLVPGFVCDSYGAADALDISDYGGWKAWLRTQ